jgi:hypothetical protein
LVPIFIREKSDARHASARKEKDKILRTDFIRQHPLSYSSLSNKCFWEVSPKDSGQLEAAKRVHIHAVS